MVRVLQLLRQRPPRPPLPRTTMGGLLPPQCPGPSDRHRERTHLGATIQACCRRTVRQHGPISHNGNDPMRAVETISSAIVEGEVCLRRGNCPARRASRDILELSGEPRRGAWRFRSALLWGPEVPDWAFYFLVSWGQLTILTQLRAQSSGFHHPDKIQLPDLSGLLSSDGLPDPFLFLQCGANRRG